MIRSDFQVRRIADRYYLRPITAEDPWWDHTTQAHFLALLDQGAEDLTGKRLT